MAITYTEVTDSFTIGSDASWTDYDIFTNKGIPKGAVVEIVIANNDAGNELEAGIREDGSTIGDTNRIIDIHEAESGGVTCVRMLTTVDSSTGYIECYAEDATYIHYYIRGYWTDVTWTERWDTYTISKDDENTWTDKDPFTDHSIPKESVLHVICENSAAGTIITLGVRVDGSALARWFDMHEAEGGGVNAVGVFVKTDATNGKIEVYGESDGDCKWYIDGYFDSSIDFTELRTVKDVTSDASWQSFDLTSDLDQDGRVVDFCIFNTEDAATKIMGAREYDAGTNRYLVLHESEGGWFSGYSVSVQSDADGVIELYASDATDENCILTGYFVFSAAETYTKNFTVGGWLQSTETKDFTVDGWPQETYTKAFTVDGWPILAGTKDYTLDGWLQATQTNDFTVDGWLQDSFIKDFTVDTWPTLVGTKDFTLDGWLSDSFTKDWTLDGWLQASFTKDFSFDGWLQDSFTKNYTFDGILISAGYTKSFTLDGWLQDSFTKNFTFDGWLSKGYAKDFTVDGWALKEATKNFTLDGWLLKAYSKGFTIDGWMLTQLTKSFTVDTVLVAAGADTTRYVEISGKRLRYYYPALSRETLERIIDYLSLKVNK